MATPITKLAIPKNNNVASFSTSTNNLLRYFWFISNAKAINTKDMPQSSAK
jgi:hypothetical protein